MNLLEGACFSIVHYTKQALPHVACKYRHPQWILGVSKSIGAVLDLVGRTLGMLVVGT